VQDHPCIRREHAEKLKQKKKNTGSPLHPQGTPICPHTA